MCFQLILLISAQTSVPELCKVWQSSLEACRCAVAVETQGVDSPKHYLCPVLLPLVLSPWWGLPPPPSTLLAICELCVRVFAKELEQGAVKQFK